MANQEIKLVISGEDRTQQAILSTGNGLKYLQGTVTKLSVQIAAFSTAWNSALAVLRKGLEYIDQAGQALRAEEAFAAMADSAEVNADRLAASMKKAADGFMDDSDLMQKAAFALDQGIDPHKLPLLIEAAHAAMRKTGKGFAETVDGIVQGIATNMPRSLRQMGAVSKEQMALLEKAAADGVTEVNLLDLVLANAAVTMAKLGPSANNAAKEVERAKVLFKEFQETIGKGLIVSVSWLAGLFYGLAASLLNVAEGYHRMRASMKAGELAREEQGLFPRKDRIEKLRAELEEQKNFAEAAAEQATEIRNKSLDISYGSEAPGGDARTEAQKKEQIAAAKVQVQALEAKIAAATQAKKATAEAKKALEAFEKSAAAMNFDLAAAALDELDAKLLKIAADADKKRAEARAAGNRPNDLQLVETWQVAEEDQAIAEWYKKFLEDQARAGEEARQQAEKTNESILKGAKETAEEVKKVNEERRAGQEAAIQARLTEIEVAEKYHEIDKATAIRERINATEKLISVQQEFLATIDPLKDPTAWRTQQNEVKELKMSLADLQEQARQTDVAGAFAASLRQVYADFTDTFSQVSGVVRKAFDGMTEALTDFVMTGKLNFTDLANSIIRDMIRIQIQQQVTGPLSRAIGNIDWGGIFDGFHSGGMGNEPTFYRLMPNPDLLPRYHRGLGPGERYSVTTNDEMILTPGQQKRFFQLAQSRTSAATPAPVVNHYYSTTVPLTINALDSRSVSQHLAQHKDEIVGMVNMAYNRLGKRGPLGV